MAATRKRVCDLERGDRLAHVTGVRVREVVIWNGTDGDPIVEGAPKPPNMADVYFDNDYRETLEADRVLALDDVPETSGVIAVLAVALVPVAPAIDAPNDGSNGWSFKPPPR